MLASRQKLPLNVADAGKIGAAGIPRVSVIVPVLNGEKTIGCALDSILAQTFSDLEIIVVDDGSTDRTADLFAQRTDDRLRLIRHDRNCGAAAARNTGIAAARGHWIAFLDSDDTWKPDKLAHQLERLEETGSGATACVTGYYLHKNGRSLTINAGLSPAQYRREIFFGCTIAPGSTLVVNRRVFDEIGTFDESFGRLEDWDWLLRFVKRYDVIFVPIPLADIYVAAQPQKWHFSKVENALDLIRAKHAPHLPMLARMKLRSSLLVEKAAMLYRAGRPLSAAAYVLAALSVYPFRNVAFFRMLWRSVRRALRP